MKKNITTILTAVLMVISLSSYANSIVNPLKEKMAKDILLNYVEATSIGSTAHNTYLFTDDFEYENTANHDKFNKKDYLKFLKENEGITYQCKTTHEMLDQSGNTAVAKSTLVFENFIRVDYITMTQSKDGWKISKIITSYL